MSDVSTTIHNLATLLEGKSTFNEFEASEAAMFEQNIAAIPAALQPAANLALTSLKEGASVLVGAGLTAIGPLLNDSSDDQATMVLNLLQAAGVPTSGPLKPAEQAALVTLINGLKAGLDRIGLKIQAPTPVIQPVVNNGLGPAALNLVGQSGQGPLGGSVG